MGSAPEKAIQKEIEKAVDFYRSKFNHKVEVHQRYDKVEKHFSWRIVVYFKRDEWVLPFGISVASMESPKFFIIKGKLKQFIINSMLRAQRRFEPVFLATPFGPEKID